MEKGTQAQRKGNYSAVQNDETTMLAAAPRRCKPPAVTCETPAHCASGPGLLGCRLAARTPGHGPQRAILLLLNSALQNLVPPCLNAC